MNEALKFLCLHDETSDLTHVARMLSRDFNFLVESVSDRQEFMKSLIRNSFDLVLVPCAQTTMEKSSVLEVVRSIRPEAILIFCGTAADKPSLAELLNQARADFILTDDLTHLADILRRVERESRERIKRRQVEEKIERLNAILRVVRHVNKLIVREKNKESLLRSACASFVENGGCRRAWIALLDVDQQVTHVSEAGCEGGAEGLLRRFRENDPPAGALTALNQTDWVVLPDAFPDDNNARFGAEMGKEHAALTMRLAHEGRLFGLLSLSVPTTAARANEERVLFAELAEDIALALYNLEQQDRHRQAAVALAEMESRYRTLVEAASDSIFAVDGNGIFLAANKRAAQELNRPVEQIVGRHMRDLFPPEIAEKQLRGIKAVFESGKAATAEETVSHVARGKCWFNTSLTPIKNESGNAQYVLGIARDITERKHVEQALFESERRLRAIFNNAALGIALTDMKERFIDFNDAWCRMLERTPTELKEMTLHDVTPVGEPPADTAFLQRLGDDSEQLVYHRLERKWLRKSGDVFWGDWSMAAICSHSGEPEALVNVVLDVTARKETERDLQKYRERLEEMVRDRTAELRNANEKLRREIVERLETEEALRESDERFSTYVNDSAYGYADLDLKGNILFANRRLAEITGYSQKELQEMHFKSILDEADWERAYADLAATLSVLDRGPKTYSIHCGDKSQKTVDIHALPLKRKGKIVGFQCTVLDISERIKARDDLRKSEENYRRFVEGIGGGYFIYRHDKQGVFNYVSPSVEKVLGFAPQDFLTHYSSHLTGNAINQAAAKHTAGSLNGVVQPPYEVETRRKDGEIRRLEVSEKPIFDQAGAVMGVEGIACDITDRVKALQAASESEKKYRTLIENLNVGVYRNTGGPQGRFLQANPAIVKIFGYENMEGFLGLHVADLYQDTRQRALFVEEVRKNGFVKDRELMLKRKDGTPIYCACTAKAQYDETGQIMWMDGVIEDITEQKIAEVQLRMAHEELETRVLERTAQLTATNLRLQEEIAERRRLEREIAGVSHYEQQRIGQDLHDGLCQYLTGIALSGKALAQKLNIRQIPEASDALKIAELTNTALTQTRSLVRGIAPVQLEMDGLMASLDELAANTKDIFNVNCTFECSEPVLLDDNTVATQLFRVAQEAVSNAVRHGRAQNIQITLCGHAGGASLVIQDDGRGFPANDQDSKGMGLRIMECRAKMIGAVLRLEKSPLKGVRVSCLLSAPGCARDE